MANYETLSDEELRAEHARLDAAHASILAEFRACAKVLNARETEAIAKAKLEAMSPQEREQFKALLGV